MNEQSETSQALGTGQELSFNGQMWSVEPLGLFDLGCAQDELRKIEIPAVVDGNGQVIEPARRAGLLDLDMSNPSHQFLVLWLTLRKADPSLTRDERDDCRYKMTKREVNSMLTPTVLAKPETTAFLVAVVAMSGLSGNTETDLETVTPKKERVTRSKK